MESPQVSPPIDHAAALYAKDPLTGKSVGYELVPSFPEFFQKTWITLQAFISVDHGFESEFLWDLLYSIRSLDIALVVLFAILFTALRFALSELCYKPLAVYFKLSPKDAEKFPESAWKTKVYACLWLYSFYVVIYSETHDYFYHPCKIWNFSSYDEHFREEISVDIYWMYIIQLGFYLHGMFATIKMDVWKKDSVMMLFHHALTIFLITFSFVMKYHKIGTIVLFLHDINDVILEVTKVNLYLKHRGKVYHYWHDVFSSAGFILFTVTWAWFRLYWFPLKVLYSTNWGVYVYLRPKRPRMYLFFNAMLFMLQGLHIYWFYFILLLLYKVATGQSKEIEDTREYDNSEVLAEKSSKKSSKSIHHSLAYNGRNAPISVTEKQEDGDNKKRK